MSRYFFDLVEDGVEYLDEEGQECSDSDVARASAIDAIRDILSATVLQGRLSLRGRLHVRDEAGTNILSIPFDEALAILR